MTNAALIYELEHVKEGSPALDVAVYAALGHDLLVPIPNPTTNLQDAFDEIERLGWLVATLYQDVNKRWGCRLIDHACDEYDEDECVEIWNLSTAPLVTCIALLKALEAGE